MLNQNLKTSQNGLDFLARWEGCILKPYKDVAGLRTIGVGHLITPGENFPDGIAITKERALQILAVDAGKCESAIKKAYAGVNLTQNMFDALVSFGFNCGVGVYTNSGVGKCVSSGNFAGVPERLLDWSKARVNGVLTVVPGIYNRRKSEGELFLLGSGITPVWSPGTVTSWSKESITNVQMKLKNRGIYKGNVDGLWGPVTSAAVTEFAKQKNISTGNDLQNAPPMILLEALNKA
jgi:lysozyme